MLTSLATNPKKAQAKSPDAAQPDDDTMPPQKEARSKRNAAAQQETLSSPPSFTTNATKQSNTPPRPDKRFNKPAELFIPFSYGGFFSTTRCPLYVKIFGIKSEPETERIDFSLDKFSTDNVERFVRTVVLKSKPTQIQENVAIYMLHGDINRNDMLNSVTSVRVVMVVRIPPNRQKKRQTKVAWHATDPIEIVCIYALKDKRVQRY